MSIFDFIHGPGSERRTREEVYAKLKEIPPVNRDFTTPEGAILCLEDAYRKRDIEAAIAAKDFTTEARLMLQKSGFKDIFDSDHVGKMAEALTAAFRAETTANWPNFDGLQSFFIKREQHSEKVVIVTEMCRFPDGGFSQEEILVSETSQGWRVLNPISDYLAGAMST